MPFDILGNKAYPLETFLMKPLARKNTSCEEWFLIAGCRKQGDALSVPLVT